MVCVFLCNVSLSGVFLPLDASFFLTDALGAVSSQLLNQASVPDHQRLHHRHGTLSDPRSAVLEKVRVSVAAGGVVSPHQDLRPGGGVSGVPVLRVCCGVDAQRDSIGDKVVG